ncbi:TRAP transporter large permease [Aminiphilus circumscriptus]|jgi:tripartite ATP-independent transporter DctM subunit|uniref:TRAP transporter large permease n=1 Tax=Aminiphilus circumscriptus TaxID=290732 RepID=UPI00047858A3|nr:TRAP transporter large permease [Aminiphilus circumscriptus]
MIGLFSIALFLVLILLRAPVASSLGFTAFVSVFLAGYPVEVLIMTLQNTVENVNYLAIVLFILVGNVANATKLSERIFGFATDMVGHIRGGLAQANILASMVFAGMSGSGIADCAGLGIIEMKAMTEYGYKRDFSAAVTAASAVVGPIIPPSISLVIYGVLANQSISKILLGGLVPGIFIGVSLMAVVYYLSVTGKVHSPLVPRLTYREKARSFGRNLSALFAPVILLSGFAFGVISPSEAGALALLYIVLLALVRREATLKELWHEGFAKSLVSIAQVMFILAAASAFTWVLSRERVYVDLANWIIAFCGGNKYFFWIFVNVFYLLNGCFIPSIATLIITIPIFLPLLPVFGIDPIHFGVVIVFNDMIGMVTPPVGSGIFVMLSVGKVKYNELVRSLVPFVVTLFVALVVLVLVPSITTFLPNLIFR